jgi:hypothetical protein
MGAYVGSNRRRGARFDRVEKGRRMPSPTIARLKSMGANAFSVTCAQASCLHLAFVTFAVAGVDVRAPVLSIADRRRFVCTQCRGRAVSIVPDWRNYRASGIGRRKGANRRLSKFVERSLCDLSLYIFSNFIANCS